MLLWSTQRRGGRWKHKGNVLRECFIHWSLTCPRSDSYAQAAQAVSRFSLYSPRFIPFLLFFKFFYCIFHVYCCFVLPRAGFTGMWDRMFSGLWITFHCTGFRLLAKTLTQPHVIETDEESLKSAPISNCAPFFLRHRAAVRSAGSAPTVGYGATNGRSVRSGSA